MSALTDAQIRAAASAAGFTGADLDTAVAIAKAESSGNASATHKNNNGSTDFGLFQINSVHSSLLNGKNWQDPTVNAQLAYQVFKSSGWGAWSTYNSGSYKQYLSGPSSTGGTAGASVAGGATGAAASTATGLIAIPGLTDLINNINNFFVGDPNRPGSHGLSFLLLPTTWVRVAAGIGGAIVLFMGVSALVREVRA